MDWKVANEIASTLQHAIASIAVIVGGAWVYFRFIRFRTLKPRVEFNIECNHSNIDNSDVLSIITFKLTNRGQTKIDLRKYEIERCFLKYALVIDRCSSENVSLLSVPFPKLKHLDIVFRSHEWVEPGETIDDIRVLKIKKIAENRVLAVQIGVEIFGPIKWSTCTAFPLVGHDGSNSFKSDDEQSKYSEVEAVQANLESILSRIEQENRTDLQNLVKKIEDMLRIISSGEDLKKRQLKEAHDLVKKAEESISRYYY